MASTGVNEAHVIDYIGWAERLRRTIIARSYACLKYRALGSPCPALLSGRQQGEPASKLFARWAALPSSMMQAVAAT